MLNTTDSANQKEERKNERSFGSFFVFLILSAGLWFLVKLSENYTTQTLFHVQITDIPADMWMPSAEQSAKMSLNIDGFHTLRYKMIREPNRVVTVSLAQIPYREENGNVYSFSSQYVAEKVADRLGINVSDITMNEAKVYFNLDQLQSKVVPVELQSEIKTQRQYDLYGIPTLEPASVTIFGPKETVDTIKMVKTEVLTKSNVSQDITEVVALDLMDGRIRSNVEEVKAIIRVEKFTEVDVAVPIRVADSLKVRFFPEAMTVKCLVAMKDYASIAPEEFVVAVDEQQLQAMQPLLDVKLVSWPKTIQVLNTHPDKVEYLIVQ